MTATIKRVITHTRHSLFTHLEYLIALSQSAIACRQTVGQNIADVHLRRRLTVHLVDALHAVVATGIAATTTYSPTTDTSATTRRTVDVANRQSQLLLATALLQRDFLEGANDKSPQIRHICIPCLGSLSSRACIQQCAREDTFRGNTRAMLRIDKVIYHPHRKLYRLWLSIYIHSYPLSNTRCWVFLFSLPASRAFRKLWRLFGYLVDGKSVFCYA